MAVGTAARVLPRPARKGFVVTASHVVDCQHNRRRTRSTARATRAARYGPVVRRIKLHPDRTAAGGRGPAVGKGLSVSLFTELKRRKVLGRDERGTCPLRGRAASFGGVPFFFWLVMGTRRTTDVLPRLGPVNTT